ncbi:MAG: hypothetical protein KGL11_10150 [Alphaproteobacteria bacterium]|nr:hypothetical protein [Alphaproteobacteria bacterium]
MTEQFFENPILNSPYAYPGRHWELDADGQPTNRIIDSRRRANLSRQERQGKGQYHACLLGAGRE